MLCIEQLRKASRESSDAAGCDAARSVLPAIGSLLDLFFCAAALAKSEVGVCNHKGPLILI